MKAEDFRQTTTPTRPPVVVMWSMYPDAGASIDYRGFWDILGRYSHDKSAMHAAYRRRSRARGRRRRRQR